MRNSIFGTIIAVIAALTAIWSSYEAHLSRLEDERPYVKVEYTSLTVETDLRDAPHTSPRGLGNGLVPHIKLTIFGKTPALNISIASDCLGSLSNDHLLPNTDDISYGMLFPGESGESHCARYMSSLQMEKGFEQFSLFQYWGIVHYQDIDGHHHQTPFCFTNDQLQKEITQCAKYTAREDFR